MPEIVMDVFAVRHLNKEVLIALGHGMRMGYVRYAKESIGDYSTMVNG